MSISTAETESIPDIEARPPLRWWHILLPLLGAVAVLAVMFLLVIVAGIVAHAMGYAPMDLMAAMNGKTARLSIGGIFYLLMIWSLYLVLRRRGQLTFNEYFRAVPVTQLAQAFVLGLVLCALLSGSSAFVVSHHWISAKPTGTEELLSNNNWLQFLLAFGIAVFAGPFAEELYFRGMLLAWLRQRLPLVSAGFLSALLFALAHGMMLTQPLSGGLYFTAVLTIVGIANVWLFVRSGSLWPPFVLHATYNGIILIVGTLATVYTPS